MTSIRKFVYATLLAASTLAAVPTLAVAQEAVHGQFKLPHEVHWQNATVPAGEYRFSFDPYGPAGMLTLTKLDGSGAGFMMLVADRSDAKPTDTSQLVLRSVAGNSYVAVMKLPQFGVTLRFNVPEAERIAQLSGAMAAAR